MLILKPETIVSGFSLQKIGLYDRIVYKSEGVTRVRQVLLAADDSIKVYSVPDAVAADLERFCLEFASDWIWNDPRGAKLLCVHNGIKGAVFNASDFIEYLNEWVFPEQQSVLVKDLGCYEVPAEYLEYPCFNF